MNMTQAQIDLVGGSAFRHSQEHEMRKAILVLVLLFVGNGVMASTLWKCTGKDGMVLYTISPSKEQLSASKVLAPIARDNTLAQSRDCSWEKPMNSACSPEEIEASGKKFADGHLQWHYTEQPVRLATVYSLNTMIFGPIESNNERRVNLSVIQGDKFQIVSISAGGILYPAKLTCTAPDCPVSVRFDQGPLHTYSTNNRSGVSMSLLDTKDFLTKIRASKKVSIVFPFAQYGNVVFIFDISGYKW